MKRTISILMGVMALALMPVLAQDAATTPVKVHGHVTNPTGAPQQGGVVAFVLMSHAASGPGSGQAAEPGPFPLDANGDYSGQVVPGTYTVIYRGEGMAKDKQADSYENVKILAGQDNVQDIDMSRQAYIDKLPEDQRKQLEELRAKNASAMKSNEVIKNLNADLNTVGADLKSVDGAHAEAVQQLGASAAKGDVDAKTNEIKTAKYTDVETLMTRDTQLRPNEPVLWGYLGQAQSGLKKYDEAVTSFKKALELDAASPKQNPVVEGMAHSGLGEVYARTGKVADANAEYDAAAKANPSSANMYLKNQAVIFFQAGNGDAQVAAADKAIQTDPTNALLYYLKGQGLIQKATFDSKTSKIVLPPGCAEAYQKYLDLAPTGLYATEVQGILQQAGQKVNSTYKAGKK